MQLLLKKYKVYNCRTALSFIANNLLKKYSNYSVFLPEYICNSVIEAFLLDGITIKYYGVDFHKKAAFLKDTQINKGDVVVCVNFYGIKFDYSCFDKFLYIWKIYDSSHYAFLDISKYDNYDFVVVGLIKTIPFVTGGGFLYTRHQIDLSLLSCNSLYHYSNEISNFIYDIALYYLSNIFFWRKSNLYKYISYIFIKIASLYNNKSSTITKMSCMSYATYHLSGLFNNFYYKRYEIISKELVGSHIRTFIIVRCRDTTILDKEKVTYFRNWIV